MNGALAICIVCVRTCCADYNKFCIGKKSPPYLRCDGAIKRSPSTAWGAGMCPVRADRENNMRAGCSASTNRRLEEICPAASADFQSPPYQDVASAEQEPAPLLEQRHEPYSARTMAQYSAHERGLFVPRLRSLPPGQFAWNKIFQRWFSPRRDRLFEGDVS